MLALAPVDEQKQHQEDAADKDPVENALVAGDHGRTPGGLALEGAAAAGGGLRTMGAGLGVVLSGGERDFVGGGDDDRPGPGLRLGGWSGRVGRGVLGTARQRTLRSGLGGDLILRVLTPEGEGGDERLGDALLVSVVGDAGGGRWPGRSQGRRPGRTSSRWD